MLACAGDEFISGMTHDGVMAVRTTETMLRTNGRGERNEFITRPRHLSKYLRRSAINGRKTDGRTERYRHRLLLGIIIVYYYY